MKRDRTPQPDLTGATLAEAFNLAGERGADPARVAREAAEAARRLRDAQQFDSENQKPLFE